MLLVHEYSLNRCCSGGETNETESKLQSVVSFQRLVQSLRVPTLALELRTALLEFVTETWLLTERVASDVFHEPFVHFLVGEVQTLHELDPFVAMQAPLSTATTAEAPTARSSPRRMGNASPAAADAPSPVKPKAGLGSGLGALLRSKGGLDVLKQAAKGPISMSSPPPSSRSALPPIRVNRGSSGASPAAASPAASALSSARRSSGRRGPARTVSFVGLDSPPPSARTATSSPTPGSARRQASPLVDHAAIAAMAVSSAQESEEAAARAAVDAVLDSTGIDVGELMDETATAHLRRLVGRLIDYLLGDETLEHGLRRTAQVQRKSLEMFTRLTKLGDELAEAGYEHLREVSRRDLQPLYKLLKVRVDALASGEVGNGGDSDSDSDASDAFLRRASIMLRQDSGEKKSGHGDGGDDDGQGSDDEDDDDSDATASSTVSDLFDEEDVRRWRLKRLWGLKYVFGALLPAIVLYHDLDSKRVAPPPLPGEPPSNATSRGPAAIGGSVLMRKTVEALLAWVQRRTPLADSAVCFTSPLEFAQLRVIAEVACRAHGHDAATRAAGAQLTEALAQFEPEVLLIELQQQRQKEVSMTQGGTRTARGRIDARVREKKAAVEKFLGLLGSRESIAEAQEGGGGVGIEEAHSSEIEPVVDAVVNVSTIMHDDIVRIRLSEGLPPVGSAAGDGGGEGSDGGSAMQRQPSMLELVQRSPRVKPSSLLYSSNAELDARGWVSRPGETASAAEQSARLLAARALAREHGDDKDGGDSTDGKDGEAASSDKYAVVGEDGLTPLGTYAAGRCVAAEY